MHCFKLISTPLFLGRKVQHLKLKHTLVVSLCLLDASSHNTRLSSQLQSVAEGDGSGEEREGNWKAKKGNKQTEKEKWGGVDRRRNVLSFQYRVPLAGLCHAKPAQISLLYIFCYCHFPCWEDSCHPSHILSAEKAALPCAW